MKDKERERKTDRQRENKDVVLPKLQYCRVISRLCDSGVICGRLIENSSPYDAVDKHFCNFFPPCDLDLRTASIPLGQPTAPTAVPPIIPPPPLALPIVPMPDEAPLILPLPPTPMIPLPCRRLGLPELPRS